MSFANKIVVITGASSGIGEVTAEEFAKLSAKVVLVGRNVDNLKRVAAKCKSYKGIETLVIPADVTKEDDIVNIAKTTLAKFNKVDVLVNNAGGAWVDTVLNPSLQIFDDIFNLNLRSVYHLTTLLAPHLIESKGCIINVSSIASSQSLVWAICYSMAKAGLDQFTRLAANELGPKGVRVNSVNPGLTKTNFQVNMLKSEEEADFLYREHGPKIPLGRICEPIDTANMIVYLASDAAKNVTGGKFVIDGGLALTT